MYVLATGSILPVQAIMLFLVWCVVIPGFTSPAWLHLRGKWVRRFLTGIILFVPHLWLLLNLRQLGAVRIDM